MQNLTLKVTDTAGLISGKIDLAVKMNRMFMCVDVHNKINSKCRIDDFSHNTSIMVKDSEATVTFDHTLEKCSIEGNVENTIINEVEVIIKNAASACKWGKINGDVKVELLDGNSNVIAWWRESIRSLRLVSYKGEIEVALCKFKIMKDSNGKLDVAL